MSEYSYTGHETAFVPTPPDINDPNVERKTATSDTTGNKGTKEADNKIQFESSGQRNVLTGYRSSTYNFTLAAVYKDDIKNPKAYRASIDELMIFKSGGKGPEGIANPDPEKVQLEQDVRNIQDDLGLKGRQVARSKGRLENMQAVQGFNKDSPGRFDFFVDNVEIETKMAFTKDGGMTLPTAIRFDLIEPYSMNGFLEALHIASVKAGYPNYKAASFLFKIEFRGYNDKDEFGESEIIPKSTRFFLIRIANAEIEVTDRGTKYVVKCIPYNEKTFGQPGKLKKAVKVQGEKVNEILEDLMANITDQEIQNAEKSGSPLNYDEYKIQFLKQSGTAWTDDKFGVIGESKLAEQGVDSNIYQMVDPAENKRKNAYKIAQERRIQTESIKEEIPYEPRRSVAQFPENANIHDVISSIIRDSEYVSKIIETVPIDEDGMLDYFMVRVEVSNKSNINPKTKEPDHIYTYIVTPYRIHFSSIPNLGNVKVDEKKLKRSVLREYNYIYTGLNTEVRNFKLQFNSLYFEAVPTDMGQKDQPGAKTAARNSGKPSPTYKDSAPSSVSSVPETSKRADAGATEVLMPNTYNAGLPKNDPFSVLARVMHEKMLNSTSFSKGELEILGDPFYLVTGGIGNYSPDMVSNLETADGEAAHIRGEVLIAVNFRNPIDINKFEQGGMMYFDSNRIPFSGVFKVLGVISNFKDGLFHQKLDMIRVPGQIIDQNIQPQDPKDLLKYVPNNDDKVKAGTTDAIDFGQRVDSATLEEQFGRGIPSPGNPGEEVNFVDAEGGLGGDSTSIKSSLFGAFASFDALDAASVQVGNALPNDFSRDVRLNQLGLASLSQINIENAVKVKTTLDTLFPGNNKIDNNNLGNDLISSYVKNNLMLNTRGSGIGEGATNVYTNADSLIADQISYTSGIPSNLSAQNIDSAGNLMKTAAGGILSGSRDKLSSLLGSRADPSALGAIANVDLSKISGLSPNFGSKMEDQIASFKNLPDNVDLAEELDRGLRLEYISPSQLVNLPPTQPNPPAPLPNTNLESLKSVVAIGGAAALARSYGTSKVDNISKSLISKQNINAVLSEIPAGQYNPYGNLRKDVNQIDSQLYSNKIQSGKVQLNPLVGSKNIQDQGLANSVTGKFGSKTMGTNPLDKLVNTNSYNGSNPTIRKNLGLPPIKL